MPKLWTDTIEGHRLAVRDAALDATATLVADGGLRSVTMSKLAEVTGVGRATLYKYFPDVESVLLAWHEREVARHLAQLVEARDRSTDPLTQLGAVLTTYSQIARESRGRPDAEMAAFLHRDKHVAWADHDLRAIVRDLIAEAAKIGAVRTDVSPDELASYCLHALSAAGRLPSTAAVDRLVAVTMTGLRRDD